jgi:hypothetical protein
VIDRTAVVVALRESIDGARGEHEELEQLNLAVDGAALGELAYKLAGRPDLEQDWLVPGLMRVGGVA